MTTREINARVLVLKQRKRDVQQYNVQRVIEQTLRIRKEAERWQSRTR